MYRSTPYVANLVSIQDYVQLASILTTSSSQLELVFSFQNFVDIGPILVMANACQSIFFVILMIQHQDFVLHAGIIPSLPQKEHAFMMRFVEIGSTTSLTEVVKISAKIVKVLISKLEIALSAVITMN